LTLGFLVDLVREVGWIYEGAGYGNFFKVGMKGWIFEVADQSGGLTATWGLGDLRGRDSGVSG
jgi:hypothetical protein